MRKARYRCKRYRLYLPKSIGELIDTNLEYVARLIGPAIVIVPKGLEGLFSRLEKLEKDERQNMPESNELHTDPLQEGS